MGKIDRKYRQTIFVIYTDSTYICDHIYVIYNNMSSRRQALELSIDVPPVIQLEKSSGRYALLMLSCMFRIMPMRQPKPSRMLLITSQ